MDNHAERSPCPTPAVDPGATRRSERHPSPDTVSAEYIAGYYAGRADERAAWSKGLEPVRLPGER